MDVLRSSGTVTVAHLADTLDIGEATVRRTLQRLARDGRVLRTYGGASLVDGTVAAASAAGDPHAGSKRAIGAAASALVEDGSTVALSSGSTVLELARHLRHRRLTIITNALDVAHVLLDAPDVSLVILGGVVLAGMHSTRGHLTEVAMRDLRADRAFMGASAIDLEKGLMTEQVAEIAVDRALRDMARDVVILADASKFDRVAPGFMFGFDRVGTIVTDARVQRSTVEALEWLGPRVVVAAEGGTPAER